MSFAIAFDIFNDGMTRGERTSGLSCSTVHPAKRWFLTLRTRENGTNPEPTPITENPIPSMYTNQLIKGIVLPTENLEYNVVQIHHIVPI
jgi:hypothetical protein